MAKDAPGNDFTDDDITVSPRKTVAAGIPAVLKTLKMSNEQMGARRTARTLTRINQTHGFDCPDAPGPILRTGVGRSSARTARRRSQRKPPFA